MALNVPYPYMQVLFSLAHSQSLRPAAVTFGVRCQDVAGSSFPEYLSDVSAAFVTAMGSQIDGNVTIVEAIGTVEADGGTGSFQHSIGLTGTSSGEKSPSNVAVLYKKQTNRPGRPGRGRFYLPWSIGEGDVDEVGRISTPALSAFQTAADTLLDNLETVGAPMYVLHSQGVPGEPDLVTSLTPDTVVATQRRRLRS